MRESANVKPLHDTQVTPVNTKWVDTDKVSEEEPMHIRSPIAAREVRSDDRPDVYGGQVSGMTHGDDFVLTGPTERLTDFENKMTGCTQSKQHSSVTGHRRAPKR